MTLAYPVEAKPGVAPVSLLSEADQAPLRRWLGPCEACLKVTVKTRGKFNGLPIEPAHSP
jgi:hypothetical protein